MYLEQMRIFAELVDNGSFSRTADQLDVSKGFVSTQIKRLEQALGRQLLLRNTRNMKLTAAGETLYPQAKQLVSFWQNTQQLLSESVDSMAGTVRFTAPTGLTEYVLMPVIQQLHEQYPELTIVTDTGNQTHNLLSEPFDFAVRITQTPPDDMVAVKLMTSEYICCASPQYLEKHGTPASPEQLKAHDAVSLSFWKSWRFYTEKGSELIDLEARLQFSDNSLVKRAALAGKGIARLANYLIEDDVQSGRLVQLFEDYLPERKDIYLLYPQVKHRPERVTTVMNAIKTLIQKP